MPAIRRLLHLKVINYSKGAARSKIAKKISRRGYNLENEVYTTLVKRFHEPFVHNQSRVEIENNRSVNVDFLVFYKSGKFAIDVFFPESDKHRFSSNVSLKYRTYRKFPFILYLCIGNEEINNEMIKNNINSHKNDRNNKAVLINLDNFLKELKKYQPLNNPFL